MIRGVHARDADSSDSLNLARNSSSEYVWMTAACFSAWARCVAELGISSSDSDDLDMIDEDGGPTSRICFGLHAWCGEYRAIWPECQAFQLLGELVHKEDTIPKSERKEFSRAGASVVDVAHNKRLQWERILAEFETPPTAMAWGDAVTTLTDQIIQDKIASASSGLLELRLCGLDLQALSVLTQTMMESIRLYDVHIMQEWCMNQGGVASSPPQRATMPAGPVAPNTGSTRTQKRNTRRRAKAAIRRP